MITIDEKKMEQQFTQLENRIFTNLTGYLDQRFEQLDTKFDEKIDELAAMTARGFAEVQAQFTEVHQQLGEMRTEIANTRNDIRILDERLTDVEEIT